MPTPLLLLLALVALVVQVVFTPLGGKPLWQTIAFVVGLNVVITALWYAANARFTDETTFVRGIEVSTTKGLRGIAVSGVLCALFGVLSGFLVWPFFNGEAPTMDWSILTNLFPTFVFMDTTILAFKRWRNKRRETEAQAVR